MFFLELWEGTILFTAQLHSVSIVIIIMYILNLYFWWYKIIQIIIMYHCETYGVYIC